MGWNSDLKWIVTPKDSYEISKLWHWSSFFFFQGLFWVEEAVTTRIVTRSSISYSRKSLWKKCEQNCGRVVRQRDCLFMIQNLVFNIRHSSSSGECLSLVSWPECLAYCQYHVQTSLECRDVCHSQEVGCTTFEKKIPSRCLIMNHASKCINIILLRPFCRIWSLLWSSML